MDLSFLKMSGDLLGRLLPKRKRRGKSATLRRRSSGGPTTAQKRRAAAWPAKIFRAKSHAKLRI
jgi:hypothetical protein